MRSRIDGRLGFMTKLVAALMLAAACGTTAAATDCTKADPTKTNDSLWANQRPLECLQDPGWFDIGAGMVVARHAGNQRQNGIGNMVTLRAYPFGRWYAPLKSQTPASTADVDAKLALQKKAAAEADSKQAAADAAKGTANEASTAAAAAQAKQDADKKAQDLYQGMQSALNDFGSVYAVQEYSVGSHLLRRISVFYGRSVGGFDSNAVQGDINAIGLAFDVAPQFSLTWGRAYFNQPSQTSGGTNPSASAVVFGIQLNLNAFKAMRNLTGSL